MELASLSFRLCLDSDKVVFVGGEVFDEILQELCHSYFLFVRAIVACMLVLAYRLEDSCGGLDVLAYTGSVLWRADRRYVVDELQLASYCLAVFPFSRKSISPPYIVMGIVFQSTSIPPPFKLRELFFLIFRLTPGCFKIIF